MSVLKVTGALDKAGVPYALVGGFAVSLHGAVLTENLRFLS